MSSSPGNHRRLEHLHGLLQRLLSARRPAVSVIGRKLAALEELVAEIEDRREAATWTHRLASLLERFEDVKGGERGDGSWHTRGEGRGFSDHLSFAALDSPPLASSSPLDAKKDPIFINNKRGGGKDTRSKSGNFHAGLSPQDNKDKDRILQVQLRTNLAVVRSLFSRRPLSQAFIRERLQEMRAQIAMFEDQSGEVATAWRKLVAKLQLGLATSTDPFKGSSILSSPESSSFKGPSTLTESFFSANESEQPDLFGQLSQSPENEDFSLPEKDDKDKEEDEIDSSKWISFEAERIAVQGRLLSKLKAVPSIPCDRSSSLPKW